MPNKKEVRENNTLISMIFSFFNIMGSIELQDVAIVAILIILIIVFFRGEKDK